MSNKKLNEGLINASLTNNLELVKYFIEKGANIHIKGDLPLMYAASLSYMEIVKYLVPIYHKLGLKNDEVLINAATSSNLDLIKYLVDNDYDINFDDARILQVAANNNDVEIMKYLIDKGASIEKQWKSMFFETVNKNRVEIFKLIVPEKTDASTLNMICENVLFNGNLEMLKYLIIEKKYPVTEFIKFGLISNHKTETIKWCEEYAKRKSMSDKLENELEIANLNKKIRLNKI